MPCLEQTSLAEKWANVCMWLIWDGLFLGRRKSLVKRTDGGGVGCFCVPHRWEPQRIPSADPFHSLKNSLSSVSAMTLNYQCNCQVASDMFWNIIKKRSNYRFLVCTWVCLTLQFGLQKCHSKRSSWVWFTSVLIKRVHVHNSHPSWLILWQSQWDSDNRSCQLLILNAIYKWKKIFQCE